MNRYREYCVVCFTSSYHVYYNILLGIEYRSIYRAYRVIGYRYGKLIVGIGVCRLFAVIFGNISTVICKLNLHTREVKLCVALYIIGLSGSGERYALRLYLNYGDILLGLDICAVNLCNAVSAECVKCCLTCRNTRNNTV